MKISNPLQMNNWHIRKLLIFTISMQLLVVGSIGLDLIGLKIPVLRQLVCFIYLFFIPGILTLRILKLHNFESIENFLYAIGLSISILMFMGFFINTFYPIIGISKPISIVPLISTISLIVLALCFLCYLIDKDFSEPNYIELKDIISVPALFLYLIPLLTIAGTYLVNFHQNNLLLMIVIFLLSLTIVLANLNLIPSSLYSLTVFVISISLLFHNSLISKYLTGWDIQTEYYIAKNVISNSLWNSSIFSSVNAMLSIVMLAPIYSIISNLDLVWVFKIIYPLIFSLLPIGLYRVFLKQTNENIAFMSVFFFVSFFVFYTEMLQLARQEIAEYYFVLLILLILQNKYDVSNRILLILFGFSTIVSHYGLSYIIMVSFVCSLILMYITSKYSNNLPKNKIITFSFMLLFSTFLIAWYMYISHSFTFMAFVNIVNSMLNSFISDLLNPDVVQGLKLISTKMSSPLHIFAKYLHISTQIFISLGIIYTIIKHKSPDIFKFENTYILVCIVLYLMLIASITVPYFSSALNTSRIYQISLILLSPFCIIGGIITLRTLFNKIPLLNTRNNNITLLRILSIFFAVFLLFNISWIYEVAGDSPTSYSLNNTVDSPKFNEQDVTGKEWLYKENNIKNNNGLIYADYYRFLLIRSSFEDKYVEIIPASIDKITKNSYIYLSTYNIFRNEILVAQRMGASYIIDYVDLGTYMSSKNQIYSSGGVKIYH